MPHLPIVNLLGAAVFAAWLVLSVLNQFKNNFIKPFQRYDIGHLLPRWTFFAPTPGTADYHLVFRDLNAEDKPITSWAEIPLPTRSAWAIAWNPQKRARKVVTDMAQSLVQFAAEHADAAAFTIPYLALLQRALAHCPPTEGAHARQFALVQTYGPDAAADPVLIFRSSAHPFVTPEPSPDEDLLSRPESATSADTAERPAAFAASTTAEAQ